MLWEVRDNKNVLRKIERKNFLAYDLEDLCRDVKLEKSTKSEK